MISLDEIFKLNQDQGHKVKVQVQICNFAHKKTCLNVYHEPMTGH